MNTQSHSGYHKGQSNSCFGASGSVKRHSSHDVLARDGQDGQVSNITMMTTVPPVRRAVRAGPVATFAMSARTTWRGSAMMRDVLKSGIAQGA